MNLILYLCIFFAQLVFMNATISHAQQIVVQQLDLDFNPEKAWVVSATTNSKKTTQINYINEAVLLQMDQLTDNQFMIAAEVQEPIAELTLVLSGRLNNLHKSAALEVKKEAVFEYSDLVKQQRLELDHVTSELNLKESELKLQSSKLKDYKRQIADHSRLSRLVEAENTLLSLERRLSELRSDRQALADLMQLIPAQSSNVRLAVLESQLATNYRDLIKDQAGAIPAKKLSLTPKRRQEMLQVIESAKGLNYEKLQSELSKVEKLEVYSPQAIDLNEEQDRTEHKGLGSKGNPL